MTPSYIISTRKVALASLIRKDGVHAVVWRESDGSFFTLSSRLRECEVPGLSKIDVVLDDQPNHWVRLAQQAFVIDAQPRSQEMVWYPVPGSVPPPPSHIEISLKTHRCVVQDVPQIGVKIFVVGERGHRQMKSFVRNIRRAVVRLGKG